jgi:hypothetical protein
MEGATMSRLHGLDFKYRLLLALSIFVGLFFAEYPPIFLLGYWTWGGFAHKVLSAVTLILNLLLAQYAAKRLRHFGDGATVKTGAVQR